MRNLAQCGSRRGEVAPEHFRVTIVRRRALGGTGLLFECICNLRLRRRSPSRSTVAPARLDTRPLGPDGRKYARTYGPVVNSKRRAPRRAVAK